MSNLEPDTDRVEIARTSDDPGAVLEVRRTSSATNRTFLWVVGLIGVVTLIAVTIIVLENNHTARVQTLTAGVAQGQLQGINDGAAVAQQSAAAARQSADQSMMQTQQALSDRAAQDRAAAEDAAGRAARSADRATRDSAASAASPATSDSPQ